MYQMSPLLLFLVLFLLFTYVLSCLSWPSIYYPPALTSTVLRSQAYVIQLPTALLDNKNLTPLKEALSCLEYRGYLAESASTVITSKYDNLENY